ncbi:Ig-like domain-containing protein [Archangium gephyra]|uniref:adventurous gliding motility protein AgmC n=1 Tax=Archangium gephyra TaxID=48 RepID=UPI0035D40541
MKNQLFKKWLAAALCVLTFGSTAALAEPDSFYLGTGRNGSRTVSTPGIVINSYAQVTAPLAPGDILLTTGTCTGDSACFAAGDLVMVLQSTGIIPEPASGTTASLDISGTPVGRWELARLVSVSGTTLRLSAPLVYSYAANVTQVIRVPEYSDLTIDPAGSIAAQAWNRSSGGVVAFLVQGTLNNLGEIGASGAGFIGGTFVNDPSGKLTCTGVDEPSPSGALKGESIAYTRYGSSSTGRGNVANGGGGGVCLRAGGGGGSNGGAGGVGGNSADGGGRAVGGMGGVVLTYPMLGQLTFGGGGGVGHGSSGAAQTGGAGGGIIFIRANQLSGTGVITASGAFGGFSNSDAASGGGGGGSIYLRLATTADCGDIDASGGTGGSTNASRVGPGGGGGGGRVLFQSTGGTCVPDINSVTGANPGTQKASTVPPSYGAQLGNSGVVTTLTGGFVVPPVPTVTTPADGSFTSNRRPLIDGTAQANTTVVIYIDGVEVGRATSNAAGAYIFALPGDLSEGSHTVQAATELNGVQSPRSTANTFTVDVTKPNTFIVSGPPSLTNTTVATFDFNASETGVKYECSLDGATYTSCTDPVTFLGLTERSHTLLVRAIDAAGNVDDSPESYTWVVDTSAPDTVIVSGPPARTNATSATFDFAVAVAEPGVTYDCSLDGAAFTSCTDPVTFTGLTAEKAYTLRVRARDAAGNVDPTPETYTWTVDLTPPETTIVSGPPARTNATSATFDFSSETGATFECSLDGAAFTSCADPVTFTGLTAERLYTLQVRARDTAGNVDPTPETYSWTVDLTPPDTVIDSGPSSPTASTSATFDFSSPEAGVSFVCRLDAAPDFTPCTDPATFTGLGDGAHRLEVSAVDAAGNMDPTPAVYLWTVDITAPDTTIVSGPPSLTNATSATFDFSSEAGATFECSLDGAAFTSCTDPVTFTGLADGSHTLEVRARDALGNVDPIPASYTWSVDTSAPDTTIVSGPAATSGSPDATFDFSSEAGATFECSLDGAAFTSCTDPVTFTGLADGSHTLEVRARDAAGNVDASPDSYTWTVDAALPDTTIVSGPPSLTNSTSATFDFSSPEAGVTYECSLDGASFTACSDPETFTGLTAEKAYTLRVRARDAAGNVDPSPASYTWTVDLTPPAAPGVVSPEQNGTVDTLTPAITGNAEPNSSITLIIDGTEVGPIRTDAAGNWSYTPTTPLTTGPHEVRVRATDDAGNVSPTSEPRTFTVVQDTSAPETTISSGPSGTTPERTATFEFSSNEPGVTFECSLDGAAYTPCTSPVTFTDLAEGEHTLRVRARDAAGNVDDSPAGRTWTVSAGNGDGDIAFLGDGVGCSATGGDASLVLMGLGTFLTLARRRRRS